MVRMAVTTQAPRNSAGELVPRAMSASTMKMPEPIIEPATSAVELKRPRLCTSRGALAEVSEAGMGVEFWSVTWRKLYRILARMSFFFSECVNSGHFVPDSEHSRSA